MAKKRQKAVYKTLTASQKKYVEWLINHKDISTYIRNTIHKYCSKIPNLRPEDLRQELYLLIVLLVSRASDRYPNNEVPVGVVMRELGYMRNDIIKRHFKQTGNEFSSTFTDTTANDFKETKDLKVSVHMSREVYTQTEQALYAIEIDTMLSKLEKEIFITKVKDPDISYAQIKRTKFKAMSEPLYYEYVARVKKAVATYFFDESAEDYLMSKKRKNKKVG